MNVGVFQSTHSITECDFEHRISRVVVGVISIHALHYRVRRRRLLGDSDHVWISIHALHYRVRPKDGMEKAVFNTFQSTHSITECDEDEWNENERRSNISIHALHYRVRLKTRLIVPPKKENFNPRTPLQSATSEWRDRYADSNISIHALHYRVRPIGNLVLIINHGIISIHALHYRVRPRRNSNGEAGKAFQSTHSITECDLIVALICC